MRDEELTGVAGCRVRARELHTDAAVLEGVDNGHDCAEHHVRFDGRDGNVDNLLNTVFHAVDVCGLVKLAVDVQNAREHGEKTDTHAAPEGNNDHNKHQIPRVRQPCDRTLNQVELEQKRVQIADLIACKEHLPDR